VRRLLRNIILLLFFSFAAYSQQDSIARGTRLREVVISSFHVNDSLLKAPASIAVLSATDLQRNNLSDIAPAVNTVAGVFMQSGALNTNRISIRGIGARTPYGTNKIRAFYGNIPLTSGDSETTIEDIDIENIEQIEIIKGPLSSVYGAGLGGAILISPKLNGLPGNSLRLSTTHGSFGLVRSNLSYGYNGTSGSLNLSYHSLESDGWRENSAYHREGVTLAGELFRGPNNKLTYFGNYTYLEAYIPSSIDYETFENNPRAAAFTWNAAQGYEQYDSYMAGLSYDWKLSPAIANATSVFINIKDSDEPRPFDILQQQTSAYGVRTQFNGTFGTTKVLAGAEFFHDDYDARTLENLYEENNGNGSLPGNQLSGTRQSRQFYNLFAQIRQPILKKLDLQAGVNLNQTQFSLENVFPAAEASEQDYNYDLMVSPQLSLIYSPTNLQSIYASVSRGFSMPAIEETLNADGLINPNIKPENGYNIEAGAKLYFLNRLLYTEVALFHMTVEDLLVAQRVGEDQYVGVNAGKTSHRGIEVSANYNKRLSKQLTVAPYLTVSLGKFTFEEFINNGTDYSGNELTGVPANKVNAGLTLSSDSGLYFAAEFQDVDDFPIDDANTVFNNSYRLWNLKGGYRFSVIKNLQSHISAGINNLANEKYASMVLVNATGFGTSAPRFYYPGLPINYYFNMAFNYKF
jgi:iron complex outermembrane receptor protein